VRRAGLGLPALAFSVHVATSRAEARQDVEAGLLRFLREAVERLRPVGHRDIKSFEVFRQVLARIERVRYEDIDSEMAVFGDPEYCIERVHALRREYGMDEFICYFNQGGRNHGSRYGQTVDDIVCHERDAILPLAAAPQYPQIDKTRRGRDKRGDHLHF
jgi:alkanesulfonate monooxygenase SsuD/methylene tetrahydromethanopterin reductase-like flavin-dependent oxidoreductase (luciferase family)